jgi:hypothetical protein
VVLKQVTDHQDAAVLSGKLVELLCVFHVKGKRLFDESILPHFERSLGQAKMLCRWRGDYDSFDILPPEKFFIGIANGNAFVLFLQLFQTASIHVTDSSQPSELVKIADKILAPISATYNGNRDVIIHDSKSSLVL